MKKFTALLIALTITFVSAYAQVDNFGGFGNFGSFDQTSSSSSTNNESSIIDDIQVTPSEFDEEEEDNTRIDRFKTPMKFTRQELNKISDPRVRDLYWYALNDTTDKKRYLRAHYAFNEWNDNWAFEMRAGVQMVDAIDFKERFDLGPQLELGFKKDLHPYWAVRFDGTWSHYKHELYTAHESTMLTDKGWNSKPAGFTDWWQEIEYTNLAIHASVMLNLLNLYGGREMLYSPFAAFVYGGAGFCYSFKSLSERDGSCLVPQWFFGAQLGFNLSQRYSIIWDASGSWQGDDMQGYNTQNSTWKYVTTLGLSYKFSKVIHFQRLGYDDGFVQQQILDAEGDDMVMQSVIEQTRDTEAALPADLIEAAFFQIDRIELQHTYVLNLGFYAELIKSHPSQKFLVKGFADLEVGPKKRNLWLSEQRAKVVADVLVKTYGVDPEQLVIGGGDLDYDIPFIREQGHHRFNRCTIVCPLDKDYKIVKEKTFDDNSELMDGRPGYTGPKKNY